MLLGGFDGLHIGHRCLLDCAKKSGFSVGLMTIVGVKEENGLFTFEEREAIFKEAGADFVFEIPFLEIKDLAPQDFLSLLIQEFSPNLFVCGEDFRFGAKAVGTPNMIQEYTHVRVETLPLVEIAGKKVSSSCIKELLAGGDMESVEKHLAHPFFLIGEVYEDRKIGRTLGFPTANVAYPQDKYPLKEGVYETRVRVEGKTYRGITNYGARPTFGEERVVTETHLIDFNGDLYGKKIKVEFIRYLRAVQKFDSVEKLRAQLAKDIRQVRD